MNIRTDTPLNSFLTMRLGGPAKYIADASSAEELTSLLQRAEAESLRVFVLGSGSNTLAQDEGFDGMVIRLCMKGVEILEDTDSSTTIRCAAGEIWDDIVKLTTDRGLTGIEAMSAIPGTIGAAPVQNIGAYGQELADTFVSLEAYDTTSKTFVTLDSDACGFSYRHSIFRGEQMGRYIITSVTLRLQKAAPQPPFYKALQDYLDAHQTTSYTPTVIRGAVMAIRRDKLPDPVLRPNTGSFFKNAIIDRPKLEELLATYPAMSYYDMGERFKVPTGWLIEQAGYKGKELHGMFVNDKNALVLINEHAQSYHDLAAARDEIIAAIREHFGITIQQEPLEMR